MTFSLVDFVLIVALIITSWRTGALYKELRKLRSEESNLQIAIREADESINRAAHAVVLLKSEGIRTIQTLEQRIHEAQDLAERLDVVMDSYDRRRLGNVQADDAPAARSASVPTANS